MQIQIENFGKIKSANVVLDGYTIFIGDNNSGKTYLMQLAIQHLKWKFFHLSSSQKFH